MRIRQWLVVAIVTGIGSAAAEETPSLREHARAWVNATDAEARASAADRILAGRPSAEALASALEEAFRPPDDAPRDEIVSWRATSGAETEHTHYAYAPPSYDPSKPMPLLVWLHGGVTRDADGGGQSGIRLWQETAADEGFLLLAPSARIGAVWWDAAGVTLLRDALKAMRRRYRVDDDRIAVGGFSDGGSAGFHLLLADPTPYCCFLALSGQPIVQRLFGGPTHVPNLSSRPVFASHGGKDALYPAERLKPLIDELIDAGADIRWKSLPEAGHDWESGVKPLVEEALAFWAEHPRRTRSHVAWQTARPAVYGRADWVEILALDAEAPSGAVEPRVVPATPPTPRPRLGISVDTQFTGDGLRVREVGEGTAAAQAGFQAGDVIVEVDGETIVGGRAGFSALRRVLDELTEESRDGAFVVLREDERVEIQARPRIDRAQQELDPIHEAPLGVVDAKIDRSSNTITVQTHGVGRLRLHLGPALVDLAKPVTVVLNGVERHRGPVEPDLGYLLAEAERLGHVPRARAALTLAP